MRAIFFFLKVVFLLLSTSPAFAQADSFPGSWQGEWKGELLWHQQPFARPKTVNMQLSINKLDSFYTWHLVYENGNKDSRPYKLIPVDPAKGHWKIDENNGIVIDMYFIGGRLTGAFTVGNTTIITSYWIENESLIAEFHNISATPISTTGNNTETSPEVKSYSVRSYQRAILAKQK